MEIKMSSEEYLQLVEVVRKLNTEEVTEVFENIFSPSRHIPECNPKTIKDRQGNLKVVVDIDKNVSLTFLSILKGHSPNLHNIFSSLKMGKKVSKASWISHLISHATEYLTEIKTLGEDIIVAFRGRS